MHGHALALSPRAVPAFPQAGWLPESPEIPGGKWRRYWEPLLEKRYYRVDPRRRRRRWRAGSGGMPGICSPGSYRCLQGRAGGDKRIQSPQKGGSHGRRTGVLGEARSESKDKKGLFVTYNLCRFNQSQGEGEIGAGRAKG